MTDKNKRAGSLELPENAKTIGSVPNRTSLVLKVMGVPSGQSKDLISHIRQGLSFSSVVLLETNLAVSQRKLAKLLSIPYTTYLRRKKSRLTSSESDRVLRYARLMDLVMDLMQGDREATLTWLHTQSDILSGETPLDHADTEVGAHQVEDLITRLQHGVFS